MKAQASAHRVSPYLTKRVTINLSRLAAVRASKRAMQLVGYIIKTENGWVVRKNSDGTTLKIKKYKTPTRYQLVLD